MEKAIHILQQLRDKLQDLHKMGKKAIWYGIFHSVSAFCNAGFDILGPEGSSSISIWATDWRILLIAGIPALIVLAVTRYMSAASLLFVTLFPIFTAVFYLGHPHGLETMLLSLFFTVMIYVKHKDNIKRLRAGTERKVGEKVQNVPLNGEDGGKPANNAEKEEEKS